MPFLFLFALALQVEIGCSVARSATDPKDSISSSVSEGAVSHRKLVRREKQKDDTAGESVVEMDSEGSFVSFLQKSSDSSNVSEASASQGLPSTSPHQINGSSHSIHRSHSSNSSHSNSSNYSSHSIHSSHSIRSDSTSLLVGPAWIPAQHVARKIDLRKSIDVQDSVKKQRRMLMRRKSHQSVPMISTYSDSRCSEDSMVAQLLLPSVKDLSSSQCVLGAASMKVNTSKDSLDKQGWQDHPTSVKLECSGDVATVLFFKAGDIVNSSCTELLSKSTIAKEYATKAHKGECVPAVDETTGKAVWFKFKSFDDSVALPACFHKAFPFLAVLLMSLPVLVVLVCVCSIRLYKARSQSRQSSMYDRFCAEQANKEVLQPQKFEPAEEPDIDDEDLQASSSESPPSQDVEEVAEQPAQLSPTQAEQPLQLSPTQQAAREEALREQQAASSEQQPAGRRGHRHTVAGLTGFARQGGGEKQKSRSSFSAASTQEQDGSAYHPPDSWI